MQTPHRWAPSHAAYVLLKWDNLHTHPGLSPYVSYYHLQPFLLLVSAREVASSMFASTAVFNYFPERRCRSWRQLFLVHWHSYTSTHQKFRIQRSWLKIWSFEFSSYCARGSRIRFHLAMAMISRLVVMVSGKDSTVSIYYISLSICPMLIGQSKDVITQKIK